MANNQNSSEQAQAGEVWDATELANGLSNWAHIVDNETSRLLLQRSAALLRRGEST